MNEEIDWKVLFFICILWTVLMVIVIIVLAGSVRGETFSINSSMKIDNDTIIWNISNVLYTIPNNVSNVTTQTNVSVSYTEVQYLNGTDVTCNCGDCVLPHNISIASSSIDSISSNLDSKLTEKTTEIINKVSEDIQFQIKPTQAQLDMLERQYYDCRENMTALDMRRYQAELQQEKWYMELEKVKSDNNIWMYITLSMFILFMAYVLFISTGGNFFNRFKTKFNF